MSDTLSGTLEHIVYANEDDHFTVGRLRTNNKETVSILGKLPGIQCGETLELTGQWESSREHGRQFRIEQFQSKLPSTVHALKKYLGSGLIDNVGPKFAEKIVDHFGTDTLRIITEESARLKEIPGVGKQRAKAIKEAWEAQKAQRAVLLFLQQYGVGVSICLKIIREYGNEAETILRRDPYRVVRDIHGIGFKTADRIALNLGFASDSPPRIDAGILHVLSELEQDGHTGAVAAELEARASALLACEATLVPERIRYLLGCGLLLRDQNKPVSPTAPLGEAFLQLSKTAGAERRIAVAMHQLLAKPSGLPSILVEKAVEWSQERAGFQFAEQQAEAVAACLSHKVSLLTGGPGTGKTTILMAVVAILKAKRVRVVLAAPTGRAVQRLAESTSHPAFTLHRLVLRAQGKYQQNDDEDKHGSLVMTDNLPELLSDIDFLIIDETSMVDTFLASDFLEHLNPSAHLLLVGDANQLPSVGPGTLLADLIAMAEQPTQAGTSQLSLTRLDKVFRQGARSEIVQTAHDIMLGQTHPECLVERLEDLDPSKDLTFIAIPDPLKCREQLIRLCTRAIPHWYPEVDHVMDVQVLPPMHKGVCGIAALNEALQQTLNPESEGMTFGGLHYGIGDKVIQTRNHYDKGIFNGDLGRIKHIADDGKSLCVDFGGQDVALSKGELADLSLAYAISIHKSQGSEFPIVVVPLLKQHFVMLQRNLLYTAITRGRRKVFVIGDPEAYRLAVRNTEAAIRVTGLRDCLAAFGHNA